MRHKEARTAKESDQLMPVFQLLFRAAEEAANYIVSPARMARLLLALDMKLRQMPAIGKLYPGSHAFLLCSDGFWECVLESEMELEFSKSNNAKEWLSAPTLPRFERK